MNDLKEQSKQVGNVALEFLNAPGVAPKLKPESMDAYQAWQQVCAVCMDLMSGKIYLQESEEPQPPQPPQED